MKRSIAGCLILAILLILVMAVSVNAATLKWDNPIPMENDGTKIYCHTPTEEEWSYVIPGNGNEIDIIELHLTPELPYNIWAVGYKGDVESASSNIVTYTLSTPEIGENRKPVVIYIPGPVEQIIINTN